MGGGSDKTGHWIEGLLSQKCTYLPVGYSVRLCMGGGKEGGHFSLGVNGFLRNVSILAWGELMTLYRALLKSTQNEV